MQPAAVSHAASPQHRNNNTGCNPDPKRDFHFFTTNTDADLRRYDEAPPVPVPLPLPELPPLPLAPPLSVSPILRDTFWSARRATT